MKASKTLAFVVMGLGLASTASKGGCGVESTDDGSSASWDTGPVPEARTRQPMTCEFLQGDNCWKRIVRGIQDCAGDLATGAPMADDRKSCTAPSGTTFEYGGPVSTPASGTTLVVGADWRIVSPSGDTCAVGKNLAIGRSLVSANGEAAVLQATSLTTYEVICPDGTAFENRDAPADGGATADAGPDLCPSFGSAFLEQRAPSGALTCDGTTKKCTLGLTGGYDGGTTIAVCAW